MTECKKGFAIKIGGDLGGTGCVEAGGDETWTWTATGESQARSVWNIMSPMRNEVGAWCMRGLVGATHMTQGTDHSWVRLGGNLCA